MCKYSVKSLNSYSKWKKNYLALPFVSNIINASYTTVRHGFKPSSSYSAPHHGYGRSDDYDYYDYGDYEDKYDRYDNDKKFRRRGRPIGRVRKEKSISWF